MYQYIAIIHCYPLGVLDSVDGGWFFAGSLVGKVPYRIGNDRNLAWGVPLADDEIVADGIFYLGQIGNYDIMAFFFLDTFYYWVTNFFVWFIFFLGNKQNAKILFLLVRWKNEDEICVVFYAF